MSLEYTLKESFAGYRRNRSATLITIFTVSIALLLLGVFVVITANISSVVNRIRSRVDIEVFLTDRVTIGQRSDVERRIRALPGVADLEFISKEKAAQIFRDDYGQEFSDILEDNPLPESFRVSIAESHNTSDSVAAIAGRIERLRHVDGVFYRKQLLRLIDRRARAFSLATLFVGAILAISAVILVANTIRLAIESKRHIIRTMRLVGATATFIRSPFLIEGIFHGFAGGLVASVLIDFLFTFAIQPLAEDLVFDIGVSFGFYVFLTCCGGVLGLIGSLVSVSRFLRETLVAG